MILGGLCFGLMKSNYCGQKQENHWPVWLVLGAGIEENNLFESLVVKTLKGVQSKIIFAIIL